MPLSTGDKIGHYEVLTLLGQGGMGEVYKARDTTLKREVALKVLPGSFLRDPDRMARFQREAEVLASLDHPNIGPIYGTVDSEESRGLVLALIEGPTLADQIAIGRLPLGDALSISKQIIEALEYAHDRGVVHRDLKPANIKITPEGVVKVLDFGLAKVLEDEPLKSSPADSPTMTLGHTRAGVILGTAAYMSPEQAVGRPVDRRSDIFSFGAVLFEMLTGKRAFRGAATPDALEAVVKLDPDWSALPAETPGYLRRLLERMMAKDRKQRLQAIGEARILLANPVGDATPVAAASASPVAGARLRWLPWAVAAAAVALAAAAYWRASGPASPRIHSFVLPPEHSAFRTLGDDAGPATLSPDGRRLAFTAATDGKVQLWVRPLDSPAAQPLAGTEGAEFPFWSHDGRWLGFFANGKLKKVEAAGGTVTVLADAPADRGGTWNQNDVILFAPTRTSFLVRVSAAGGAVTPVTHLDEKRLDISHRWPFFLPDGKHFLFTSRGKGVFVAALDGNDPPRRLLEESSNAIYSAGYLLYSRGNTLLARPFDSARGEFTGEAVNLAQNMAGETESDRGCFTAAAGLLAYHSGLVESRLTWTDRGGNRAGTVGAPGVFNGLEISPDGSRVATVVEDGSGAATIWVTDLSRGARTRVFSGTGLSLAWSPDGKRLAVGFARDGAYAVSAWNADGSGGEEVLSRSNFQITPTFWMPNGGLLLDVRDPRTGFDIDYLPPAGNDGKRVRAPVLHAPGDQLAGTVSPNGRWILYTSDDGAGGIAEGFVARFPGAGSRRPVSTTGADIMRWSRDGKEILFSSRTKLMSATVRETGESLEIAEPRMLFEMRVDCGVIFGAGCFDVSQDGKRFLVMEPTGAVLPVALVQNWQAGLKK
ncbi:MAG: serine/threonine-protein kinase [Candidatus Solibacter usitatus]|nr:serine/threonine-protein kinase [Candidatus Solibacter usitatus]